MIWFRASFLLSNDNQIKGLQTNKPGRFRYEKISDLYDQSKFADFQITECLLNQKHIFVTTLRKLTVVLDEFDNFILFQLAVDCK